MVVIVPEGGGVVGDTQYPALPGGHVIGTLCVLDLNPRELDDGQHGALAALARQVMAQLELRAALRREREATCVIASPSTAPSTMPSSVSTCAV